MPRSALRAKRSIQCSASLCLQQVRESVNAAAANALHGCPGALDRAGTGMEHGSIPVIIGFCLVPNRQPGSFRRTNKNNQNSIIDSYSRLSCEACSRSFKKTRIGLLSRSSEGRLISRQRLACSSRLICELNWVSSQVLSETIVSVLAVKLA